MHELLQFRHSPYNEKVRWVLDLKRIEHRRRSLLPGPHLPVVRRLTGRSQTPVLVHGGVATDGSAEIVAWLDAGNAVPALMPADRVQRDEVLRIQRWFDDDLTPRIRRPILAALLANPRYFARVFGEALSPIAQAAYALVVPLAGPVIRKGNGITDDAAVNDGLLAAQEALNFVAERSIATGYLVGASLTLADITAAATLATLVRPADSPMACPQPVGPAFLELMERFRAHPGAAWVCSIYAKHRLAKRDFEGPSGAQY